MKERETKSISIKLSSELWLDVKKAAFERGETLQEIGQRMFWRYAKNHKNQQENAPPPRS